MRRIAIANSCGAGSQGQTPAGIFTEEQAERGAGQRGPLRAESPLEIEDPE